MKASSFSSVRRQVAGDTRKTGPRRTPAARRFGIDPYAILQVSPGASPDVIHAAYRALARVNHPDHPATADCSGRMQLINAAYALLRDPVVRADFDARARVAQRRGMLPVGPPESSSTGYPRQALSAVTTGSTGRPNPVHMFALIGVVAGLALAMLTGLALLAFALAGSFDEPNSDKIIGTAYSTSTVSMPTNVAGLVRSVEGRSTEPQLPVNSP